MATAIFRGFLGLDTVHIDEVTTMTSVAPWVIAGRILFVHLRAFLGSTPRNNMHIGPRARHVDNVVDSIENWTR